MVSTLGRKGSGISIKLAKIGISEEISSVIEEKKMIFQMTSINGLREDREDVFLLASIL